MDPVCIGCSAVLGREECECTYEGEMMTDNVINKDALIDYLNDENTKLRGLLSKVYWRNKHHDRTCLCVVCEDVKDILEPLTGPVFGHTKHSKGRI